MAIKTEITKTCELSIPSKNQNVIADITEFLEGRSLTIKVGDLTTKLLWHPTKLKYSGKIGGFEILTLGPQQSVTMIRDKPKHKKK
jgi:hypothetical protein